MATQIDANAEYRTRSPVVRELSECEIDLNETFVYVMMIRLSTCLQPHPKISIPAGIIPGEYRSLSMIGRSQEVDTHIRPSLQGKKFWLLVPR